LLSFLGLKDFSTTTGKGSEWAAKKPVARDFLERNRQGFSHEGLDCHLDLQSKVWA